MVRQPVAGIAPGHSQRQHRGAADQPHSQPSWHDRAAGESGLENNGGDRQAE